MYPALLTLALSLHVRASGALQRLHRSERGEGVISAAIAVLVMAFLGVAMWIAFKGLFASTTEKTGNQVSQIGN
ncbi:hypothetical protein KSP35_06260 [Aquihabitans sp. G128]|uniref:hypothetical protein n=1 Tax=Aquihabitans sp. G128 TaxID=2849779 RepID=UPI001C22FDFA|nr:hypothetical protein [Aquihabitans sp. G128]QXC62400.1 hypothetical protein KSP35_06260 [Aquihabitans sp. G128]